MDMWRFSLPLEQKWKIKKLKFVRNVIFNIFLEHWFITLSRGYIKQFLPDVLRKEMSSRTTRCATIICQIIMQHYLSWRTEFLQRKHSAEMWRNWCNYVSRSLTRSSDSGPDANYNSPGKLSSQIRVIN